MEKVIQSRKNVKCSTMNKGLLKVLAAAQLSLAFLLSLFTMVIDPPSLINIAITSSVIIIEGSSMGIVWNYLRNGCFT
ncbi:hypothetical protein [Vulcanisaeta distributa]|uniref:hypothetical protein n=1 Tax=Vulcanisaeta distributa TaxID=164451 RepID=UPI0006D04DD7|nr:hypothetical protein [Vulcanisaeta distributa]